MTDLTDKFRERFPKFPKAPAIINEINQACEESPDIPDDNFVNKFNIKAVKALRDKGISDTLIPHLYVEYDPNLCNRMLNGDKEIIESVGRNIAQYHKTNTQNYKVLADWSVEHIRTSKDTIKKLEKNIAKIKLNKNTSVKQLENDLKKLNGAKKVKELEKRYKDTGFVFDKITCELKDKERYIEDDKYRAYIMSEKDNRQVLLGDYTNCCQKIDDTGESAMMHGLIHPKAGFWCVEDKSTGTIKAQAECWELNEDTLVFDNIEFANDADIVFYRDIIGKWLTETSYSTVIMGNGYNEFYSKYPTIFPQAGSVTPPVCPYEIYVISHEHESSAPVLTDKEEARRRLENGECTYYDYVYCDSENNSSYLKINDRLIDFFKSQKELLLEDNTIRELISLYENLITNLNKDNSNDKMEEIDTF